MKSDYFSDQLVNWYDQHGRKDLPWQQSPTPYHVWLSEIMLQQTQVTTVVGYYQRFIDRFPDVISLAKANSDDVLALWTGLGYYARARNLHKSANIIVDVHNGKMPTSLDHLTALPGIGRSTAGAIMALAHHQRYAILDGNVKRVLARYFAVEGWPGNKAVETTLWQLADSLLPDKRIANYIQAQMDLGATLCTRTKPRCCDCPLKQNCLSFIQGNPESYPFAKPKKISPIRKTNWIIAQNPAGEILLEQRQASGIWGGLWTFPEFETTENIEVSCQNKLNISIKSISTEKQIRHIFSHFKLDIRPYFVLCDPRSNQIAENKNLTWYRINKALELGLPAPVKSLLISLQ
ncbi:MAG: A/G-specific adenine glycosylase [Gammaproteobacteria bacterium]|nr:A/G-specific adenine glycosylase [Gammaproteobacteria bacterium]